MKKIILILILLLPFISNSQYYISAMPSLYAGSNGNSNGFGGSLGQRSTFDMEFGYQWEVFSVGLDFGKTTLSKNLPYLDDGNGGKIYSTTPQGKYYTEIRPNLNIFQQGKWTNTMTIGLGYIYGANENVLMEYSSGIQYTPKEIWSYNLYFGTYYFSGRYSSSSSNFVGISVMYYIKPGKRTGIFNKKD